MKFETLGKMQRESCKKFADHPLFGTKTDGVYQWITYQQFGKLVEQCRGGLAQLDVKRGEKVAFISNNRVEWAVAAYATYSLGAVFVPMYESQLAKEWKYIIDDSESVVLVVANDEIFGKTEGFVEEVEHLRAVIRLTGSDEHSWEHLLKTGAENAVEPLEGLTGDDLAGLIYTSGTTGNPKGVMLSHGNFTSNINAVHEIFPMEDDDRSLSFLPWAHSFGQTCELHCLLSMGASLGLAESAQTLIANFSEVQPTLLFSVPRVFNKIYDALQKRMAKESPVKRFMFNAGMKAAVQAREAREAGKQPGGLLKFRLNLFDKLVFSKVRDRFGGRLRYAFSGGAALSKEVGQFIDDMNITVYEGYGLTETSPIVTANRPGAHRLGSVGKSIPGCDVVVDGADGQPDVEGEVLVSGPNVMQGYFNLDDQTAEVLIDRDGKRFFRTGDLGRYDKDGFLFITGRLKEIYKLENGKYVAPAPLEEKLQLSGFIVQAFLHGANKQHNVLLVVPDELAVTEWAKDKGIAQTDLASLCENEQVRELIKAEIAKYADSFKGYERPKNFKIIPEEFTVENAMLTPSMKVKRRAVLAKWGDALEVLYE